MGQPKFVVFKVFDGKHLFAVDSATENGRMSNNVWIHDEGTGDVLWNGPLSDVIDKMVPLSNSLGVLLALEAQK